MSVICRTFFLKLALRTYIFLKLSHASTLSVWTEEIQAKTGEWTKQTAIYCDTFWLQSFNTRNSSFRKCKNLCYCTVFALFHFGFEDNFRVQASGGGLGGAICRFFFGGGGGLMHGEVIFGILRYILIWWKMNELSPPVKRAVKNLLDGQKDNFFLRDQRGKSRAGPILPARLANQNAGFAFADSAI